MVSDTNVINVPGIGIIGQYDSWLDLLDRGDMGILYFFRDYYTDEVKKLEASGDTTSRKVRGLVQKLKHLHAHLSEHEKKHGFPYALAPDARRPRTVG